MRKYLLCGVNDLKLSGDIHKVSTYSVINKLQLIFKNQLSDFQTCEMLIHFSNYVNQEKCFSSKGGYIVYDQDSITERTHLFTKTKKENPPK